MLLLFCLGAPLPASHLPSFPLQEHIRMGEALAPFREKGALILGSGLSFHNMAAFDFRGRGSPDAIKRSKVTGHACARHVSVCRCTLRPLCTRLRAG